LEDRGADTVSSIRLSGMWRFMSPFAAMFLTFIGVINVRPRQNSRGGSGFQIAMGIPIGPLCHIILFLLSEDICGEWENRVSHTCSLATDLVFAVTGLFLYKTVPSLDERNKNGRFLD